MNVYFQSLVEVLNNAVETNSENSMAGIVMGCLANQLKYIQKRDESAGPENAQEKLYRMKKEQDIREHHQVYS